MINYFYLKTVASHTLHAFQNNDWRHIPIEENNEPLIEVPQVYCQPYYVNIMHWAEDSRIYLRKGTFKNFLKAKTWLNRQGFDLIVYDGWRSIILQEKLFWLYLQKFTVKKFQLQPIFAGLVEIEDIKKIFNSLNNDLQNKLIQANRQYVSLPSQDLTCPSPHVTGGAIDVWLYQDDKPVDLGVPFDYMEEEAGVFYHLNTSRMKFSNDKQVIKNRNLLITAMLKAGFTCLPSEIWHYNYGNQMYALIKKTKAFYSYIEPSLL